jgi:hypothetical protein
MCNKLEYILQENSRGPLQDSILAKYEDRKTNKIQQLDVYY